MSAHDGVGFGFISMSGLNLGVCNFEFKRHDHLNLNWSSWFNSQVHWVETWVIKELKSKAKKRERVTISFIPHSFIILKGEVLERKRRERGEEIKVFLQVLNWLICLTISHHLRDWVILPYLGEHSCKWVGELDLVMFLCIFHFHCRSLSLLSCMVFYSFDYSGYFSFVLWM